MPLEDVANAVTATTTLVACSHVSWMTGELAPAELAELDVPVILDGAQGAGAIPLDMRALGCAAYAAAGQKWLCGADGTGMLYVAPEFGERVRTIAPALPGLRGRQPRAWTPTCTPTRAASTRASLSREASRFTVAAIELLESSGLDAVHERATQLAETFAEALADSGRTVAPRGDTTLVAWEDPDPEATRERLTEAGIVIRNLPGTPYLRASVGAWNDESDLERLLGPSP